jgi:hypothetical protein
MLRSHSKTKKQVQSKEEGNSNSKFDSLKADGLLENYFLLHCQNEPKSLELMGQSITDAEIPDIIKFMLAHPQIKSLELGGNSITDAGMYGIACMLPHLQDLDLSCNEITGKNSKAVDALVGMPNLRNLYLVNNDLDSAAIRMLKHKESDMKEVMNNKIHVLQDKYNARFSLFNKTRLQGKLGVVGFAKLERGEQQAVLKAGLTQNDGIVLSPEDNFANYTEGKALRKLNEKIAKKDGKVTYLLSLEDAVSHKPTPRRK